MTEKEFHLKYIAPYYMSLMNLNFTYKSKEETEKLIYSLKKVGEELSNEKLIEMLNDVWRPSKISAWIIGLTKPDLIAELIKSLQKSGRQYSEHILINLLILDNQNSEEFTRFINQQMNYFIETNDVLTLQNLSIDWSISILNYLDNNNQTNNIETLKSSVKWIEFDKKINELKYADGIKETFKQEYYLEEITTMMERINCG